MVTLPCPHRGLSIGLLGGSFNPAHSGHLHVAETAMKALQLDWVWWIVARGNPLKSAHGEYAARFDSARTFTLKHPRMRVSDIEVQANLTYTVDLVSLLKQRANGARFVWLMGSDSFANFHHWKDWRTIARSLPIAVVARPGSQRAANKAPFAEQFRPARLCASQARGLRFHSAPAWTFLSPPMNSLSSTELRER